MGIAENVKDKKENTAHHQERMRVIQIMAPVSYEFSPDRPPQAFELEVGFTDHRRGQTAPVRFESADLLFKELHPSIDRQDLLPNLGKPFFFVNQVYMPHDYRPETHHVELFLPEGLVRGYLNIYSSLGYQTRSTFRETTPRSTVLDLLALVAFHNTLSLDWLFDPTMSVKEFLKHIGLGDDEGVKKGNERERESFAATSASPWINIRQDVDRAMRNRDPRGGQMHRQGDSIAYFFAENLLPIDPTIRQMLQLPAATLVNYVPGF